MKLLPVNLNRTFTKLEDMEVLKVLEESLDILSSFKELSEILLKENEVGEDVDYEEFLMEQLDVVESVTFEMSYDTIDKFIKTLSSPTDSIHRRGKTALHYLELATKVMGPICEEYIPMSDEQIDKVSEIVDNVLGELAYFVYYLFDVDKTVDSVESGEEMEVNVVLSKHGGSEEGIMDVVNFVRGVLKNHKPKLSLFEAFPEFEEEFYFAAGAYIRDFDELSDHVTIHHVKDIILNKREVEDVVREIEAIAAGKDNE